MSRCGRCECYSCPASLPFLSWAFLACLLGLLLRNSCSTAICVKLSPSQSDDCSTHCSFQSSDVHSMHLHMAQRSTRLPREALRGLIICNGFSIQDAPLLARPSKSWPHTTTYVSTRRPSWACSSSLPSVKCTPPLSCPLRVGSLSPSCLRAGSYPTLTLWSRLA